MSRHIGKAVWQSWGGTLRWGVIRKSFVENRWRYYNIDWIDDEAYKGAQKDRTRLLGSSAAGYEIYQPVRCDHVNLADLDKINNTVKKLFELEGHNAKEG